MMQQGNVRVVLLNVTLDELSTDFGLQENEYCPLLCEIGPNLRLAARCVRQL
jgi:hypothetical protein